MKAGALSFECSVEVFDRKRLSLLSRHPRMEHRIFRRKPLDKRLEESARKSAAEATNRF